MTLLFAIALLGGGPPGLAPFSGPCLEPEETVTTIQARDLLGERQRVPDPAGLDPTLLMVAQARHGPEEVLAWLEEAERSLPPGARLLLLLEADEARARELIPERHWGETVADPDRGLAAALGLCESRWPRVVALDEVGRVLVEYRGRADDPAARRVWAAIRPYPGPVWPVW